MTMLQRKVRCNGLLLIALQSLIFMASAFAPRVRSATSPVAIDSRRNVFVAAVATTSSSSTTTTANQDVPTPGARENEVFELDDSVIFWQKYAAVDPKERLDELRSNIADEMVRDRTGRAYFTSHALRTGYFSVNSFLAVAANDVYERFVERRETNDEEPRGETTNAAEDDARKNIVNSDDGGMIQRLLRTGTHTALWEEVFHTYLQDYRRVKAGSFRYPWDAALEEDGRPRTDHRQTDPLFLASSLVDTVRDGVEVFSRRRKRSSEGVFVDKQSNIYPDYYLNDFHYQTGGWLSAVSARRYEASTEGLFLGRQDAMQRGTLLPLSERERRDGTIVRNVLEVACGTGRLGTFLRDNHPDADVTYADLSPFYLERARENDEYWRSYYRRGRRRRDETASTGVPPRPASFVQANAERLPFPDDSFDAVVCVYLFHELPEDARARAAAEMARVVRPGGTVVLTDSVQFGDRPGPNEKRYDDFANLNEPHYRNYMRTYLPDLFTDSCDPWKKYVASSTKTLSFVKR